MGPNHLTALERIVRKFGPGMAEKKLEHLSRLATARLETPSQVRRLHEALCFLRAYPDSRRVLSQSKHMLEGFERRRDLRKHAGALANSGIIGTEIRYRFYQPTADWIAQRWPGALRIDRSDREPVDRLSEALGRLLPNGQAAWLREETADAFDALDRMRPKSITDADFLLGLIRQMPGDEFIRETLGDGLDLSYILSAGRGTPERTTAHFATAQPIYQTRPLNDRRIDLRKAVTRAPKELRRLGRDAAARLVEMARVAMVTRERDLAAFQFADIHDVFLMDDGDGLVFAMMGTRPVRRALFPATYGSLTLKNGVPIGYAQVDVLGRHAEISFNQFDSFRGAESNQVFARYISTIHHVFGCDSFSIEPFQLGLDNDEGIETGAWWFYYKHGFRPRLESVKRLARRELARLKKNPKYRSGVPTLRAMAKGHLFFHLSAPGKARLPSIRPWLEKATKVFRRYRSADPRRRNAAAAADAVKRLGLSQLGRFSPAERAAFVRWAPLVLAIDGLARWSRSERTLLLRIIKAKGGRRERDFNLLLLKHPKLRALLDC